MKAKKEINVLLGNNIRIAREKAGLTQTQFGQIMSLDAKNVSDIERGVTGITISTLKRICEKLPISSDILLFGEQNYNKVDYLTEKLKRLPPDKFAIIEALVNKYFQISAMVDQS